MFLSQTSGLAISLLCHGLVPDVTANLVIDIPQLYPENGASLPSTGKMYFSSLYKSTVVEFDPKNNLHKEIAIPNITGNRTAHISGIEADYSGSFIWAIADPSFAFSTNGQNLDGPEALICIKPETQLVHVIDLKPTLTQAALDNGGVAVGGTQDAVVAPDGTVYVAISFGQTILKVDPMTSTPRIFYSEKNPRPNAESYSGIELVNDKTLLVWNCITSGLESFDIEGESPTPKVLAISQLPGVQQTIIGDAIFVPSISQDQCLLVSNNGANTIEVFRSTDRWSSAIHSASINASIPGGAPTFTYEMQGRVYAGIAFMGDGDFGGSRRQFPQMDITAQVHEACSN